MSKIIFTTCLIVLTFSLDAQETQEDWRIYKPAKKETATRVESEVAEVVNTARYQGSSGRITYSVDRRILEMDSLLKEYPEPLEGYRVQLFFGGRAEAQKLRSEFVKKYADTQAYISYLAPNFRLRVGDFRTKLECEEFKALLLPDFAGSYIVKDEIELPSLERKAAQLTEQ